jgi:hypothetical protein
MSFNNSPFFARILFAAFYTATGWFFCSKFESCREKSKIPRIQAELTARLDNIATQIDSLYEVNDSLSGWIILHKNPKPNIQYRQKDIFITDTVYQITTITDSFQKEKLVYIDNPITKIKQVGLQLPINFTISDTPHLKIAGHIDSIGIHSDTIRIINTLALRDQAKRTFFQEHHALSFAQSNPYISTTIPIYTYQKPTKKGILLQKIGYFIIGTGVGYGIRTIQKK